MSVFSSWVLFCFFFSGVAGLIYQVLWLRMIDKVIGSAPFAVATVLSVFMGGLALGSWLAGKYIDRIASRGNLISLYGIAELAIGIYGLIFPFLTHAAKPVYVLAYNSLFMHFWLYRLFTFFGCSVLLLVPTTLMGITLPVLCRFYVEDLGHIGTRTGRLYGINTIGAAVGAIVCGFVLIAKFGVWGSLGTAVGINFLVGVLCIGLGRGNKSLFRETTPQNPGTGRSVTPTRLVPATDGDRVAITFSLWIFAISGFCAMAYEVFWTRLLGLTIGPTTYSFSLVVSTFIIGLALGNILFGWLADRVSGAFYLLIITQAAAACLALVVSQFLGNSQFFFSKLIYTFQGNFEGKVIVQSVILFFVLVGPTIFLGATFPLVNRIYARSLPNLGRSIGTAYAMNTIGAILGSFVAGFLLIPFLGKENGLRITTGLQIFISFLAMASLMLKKGERLRAKITGPVILVLGVLLLINFPSWDHSTLSRGWYYRFDKIRQYFSTTTWVDAIWKGTSKIARQMADVNVVFYGDGVGGFTTVEKWVAPTGTANYYLLNSGKTDASSHSDRLTQALSAHIPLLFQANPKKVMVLGLASGMTAGEALLYPIKQLDVLEINDQVIKAAQFFAPYNNHCLTNPRTRVIVQDGRNHLELTKEKYDVIISEPSNPWMAGLANLFTLDYFKTVKKRLTENGVFVQWTNAYDMDWDSFSMIGRTFAKVFPNGILFRTIGTSDFLLVGFSGEKNLDLKTAEKNMVYASKSQNVIIRNPDVIFKLIVTEDLETFFGPGPLHTDNWPRLEFAAPKNIGRGGWTITSKIQQDGRLSKETQKILSLGDSVDASLDYLDLMTAESTPPFGDVDLVDATKAQQKRYQDILDGYCSDEYVTDYDIFPNSDARKSCADLQVARIRKYLTAHPENHTAYFRLATGLGAMGETQEEIEAYRKAISLNPLYFDAYMRLGETFTSLKRFKEAISELSEALKIEPDSAKAYNNLGNVLADEGNTDQAISYFSKALQINPDFAMAHNNLGGIFAALGKTDEAIYHFSKAIDIEPGYAAAHDNLGRLFAGQGQLKEALAQFQEAVKYAPESADFHNDVGMILGQQGKIEASMEQFSTAIRINPKHFLAQYNMGVALLNLGRIQEAADHFFKAIEINPQDAEVHRLLGMALGNLGRTEEAAGQFSESLKLDPNSSVAHDNLGVALLKMGRINDAIEQFHEALDIDETFQDALEHLQLAVKMREQNRPS